MSMLAIFKPVGIEVPLTTTAITVDNAKLVRVVNDTAAAVTVQLLTDADVVYASFTLAAAQDVLVQKNTLYKIKTVSGTIKVVKASF